MLYRIVHKDGSETKYTRQVDPERDLGEGEYIITWTRLWGWRRVHLARKESK